MTAKQMKAALSAAPFQAFTVQRKEGCDVPVQSRELVVLSPSGRTLVVIQPDDRMNIIDVPQITNLVFDAHDESQTRGKGRRSAS